MSAGSEAGEESGPETDTDEEGLVGTGKERREDRPLLRGRGEYTDDMGLPGMAHLAFVRSEVAHAELLGVDTGDALAEEGVLAVYTVEDWADSDSPGVLPISSSALDGDPPGHPVLARDRIRYQGQPVAAVVATDRYRAHDATDLVEVRVDEREPVVDPREAADPEAPQLYDPDEHGVEDNVAATNELGDQDAVEDAFAGADNTLSLDLRNNRLIASAMEPRVALADYDTGDETFEVTLASQSAHGHRRKLSHTLGVPESDIHVVSPDVGGGFGHKGHHHPGEAMAAFAARDLDRPVKWTATRSGNYLEGAHGRDHRTRAELAYDDDGAIRGLRAETHAGAGGFCLGGGGAMAGWYGRLLSSQYEIPAIYCHTTSVFTTTAPIHSYRGAGRPEANYVTERLVKAAADDLGMDPATLRRRNYLEPDQFPYETPVGSTYDSGNYRPALDAALDTLGLVPGEDGGGEDTADGRRRGVGLASYVESSGGGYESGVVRVHPDGGVTVYAGTHDHGQGHGTTYAQLVADELGVDYDRISVVEGDSEKVPTGTGTFGSRSTIVGGSAVTESAAQVAGKARRVAAGLLECDPDDVRRTDDGYRIAGGGEQPEESVAWGDVASAAYGRGLPDDLEPGLEATTFYEQEGGAYTFGTHAVSVLVDPETGDLEVERYVAVDDCGERVNPTIVEGQVHGGVAQGLGQALTEHAVYGADGELKTDSLWDYAVPGAEQLPDIETDHTVTPSPNNPLGVKGIGEGGTIAAPPAVVNAVVDALPGVEHLDMPLTSERVWRALQDD